MPSARCIQEYNPPEVCTFLYMSVHISYIFSCGLSGDCIDTDPFSWSRCIALQQQLPQAPRLHLVYNFGP